MTETGDPVHDALTVEHNGFLSEKGLEQETVSRCLDWLVKNPLGWDEIRISGLDERDAAHYCQASRQAGLSPFAEMQKPYFFVNLETVGRLPGGFLATVSRNTRYQVRRAMRVYEEHGAIAVRAAASQSAALELLGKLRELHQAYWMAKGYPGAFASRFVLDFHDSLIRSRFAHGDIQLLEIAAGNKTIGYLYNFLKDGVVSNYQSGFVYEDDSKAKPGLVSHYQAIEFNLRNGHTCYDFLMGDQRYKRSLATNEEQMIWLVLQRKLMRFKVEHAIRHLWNRLRSTT